MNMNNYNKKQLSKAVSLVALSVAATGCMNNVKQAEDKIARDAVFADIQLKHGKAFSDKKSFIREHEGIFVGGDIFKLNERDSLPAMFKQEVIVSEETPISLAAFMSKISDQMGVRIMVASDALEYLQSNEIEEEEVSVAVAVPIPGGGDSTGGIENLVPEEATLVGQSGIKISMMYEGTLEGMLDVFSTKANLFWKWENKRVILYRTVTKTFILDTLSGKTKFESTVNSKSTSTGASDGQIGTAGSSTNSSNHVVTFKSDPDSPWEAVKESVEAMLTEGGKVAFGEQTGTVTVTDTPSSVERVSEYIKQINKILSQRIAVKTEIFDIVIDDNDNFGTDLEALFSGSNNLNFKFNSGFKNSGTFEFGIISPTSKWTGSQAFINALQEKVRTSEIMTNQVFTTNGVPVPVQIVNTEGYIASTTVTSTDTGTATELQAGTISTGLNMALVPKVLSNGDIMLHMSLDISRLNEMRSVSSPDGSAVIELPNTSAKTFSQRIAVRSGETIMISGFEQTRDDSVSKNILGEDLWFMGGNKKGGSRRTKTIILITPISVAR